MDIKERKNLDKYTHSVRASQAVLQYGVGAMVDFPEQTLMTAAPETWEASVIKIHDERLEKEILKVDYIGMPGSVDEAKYQDGISFVRFPEWYFCPKCRSFKNIKAWVSDYSQSPRMRKKYENDPYMTGRIMCSKCFQDLVVARLVVACGQGHIDDFPWVKWVHAKSFGGPKKICGNPRLKFKTTASSTEGLEGLTIICETCRAKTTLRGAFDQNAFQELDQKTNEVYNFRCSGRHPWKNTCEKCGKYPHVLQRGSSSVYFPVTESSIVIPPYSSRLTRLIENSQGFARYKSALNDTFRSFKTIGASITQEQSELIKKTKIDEFSEVIAKEIGKSSKLVRPILERKSEAGNSNINSTKSPQYKAEEYSVLNGEIVFSDDGDFVREGTEIGDYNIPFIKGISLIHKLREVQALVGFSRLEPIENDYSNTQNKIKMVNIKQEETKWYPGYEVRGEGIFIEFDEEAINEWRSQNTEIGKRVQLLNENYANSYYGSKRPRVITAKFLLLHTISHLLMKQLSFECGYNIASIKERLYCSERSEGRVMSGIFIYTASGDSEGTMGGLVRQGRPDIFPKLFKTAIDAAVTCSNDPVCSLSQGQGRDSLNISACYSCSLVPETSCEEFNVFLDRGVVVGTFEKPDVGFFSRFVNNWGREVDNTNRTGILLDESEEEQSKNKSNEKMIIVKDYGVMGSTHKSVWENLSQFANTDEKEKIAEILQNIEAFKNREIPGCDGTLTTIDSMDDYGVDLIWKKSGVMVFSSENQEEYMKTIGSTWKCFALNDSNFSWKKLLNELMED